MSTSAVTGISVVCVFNDAAVRRQCLDRSIEHHSGTLDVDYIPVDNTTQRFSTAGAALNHGARQARYDTIVFVHQDVYLHSVVRLAEAGSFLDGDEWGIIGANGFSATGRSLGRLRDRVQLIGSTLSAPAAVDSLDEVLFLIRRDRVLAYPISEDPHLAWHAYAVEYGCRMRRLGLGVGAVDTGITHNSLTINLDRLDIAHLRVAQLYPELLPLRTTCGTVAARTPAWRRTPVLGTHAWRVRWLRRSVSAHRASRRFSAHVVLSDIRHDVDLLSFSDEHPLHLLNLDVEGGFADLAPAAVRLERRGRPVICSASSNISELREDLAKTTDAASVLVPDLTPELLDQLGPLAGGTPWVIGLQAQGLWLLGGAAAGRLPNEWSRGRAVPLGARPLDRTSLPV